MFLNFRRLTETLIVMLSLPFALVGGVWLMWWMGFNTSVAVAVGFIALAGVAAETGVIMLIYLDHALAERRAEVARVGRAFTRDDLDAAIMVGAVERVRPKMMTVVAIMAGLMPILWAHGTGSEVMSRIAVPMKPRRYPAGTCSLPLAPLNARNASQMTCVSTFQQGRAVLAALIIAAQGVRWTFDPAPISIFPANIILFLVSLDSDVSSVADTRLRLSWRVIHSAKAEEPRREFAMRLPTQEPKGR